MAAAKKPRKPAGKKPAARPVGQKTRGKKSGAEKAAKTAQSAQDPRAAMMDAALALAAVRDWDRVSLREIADEAGIGLGDAAAQFSTKNGIIRAFLGRIDRDLVNDYRADRADEGARDRLFDILMRRFDLLAPHKPALRNVVTALEREPFEAAGFVRGALASQNLVLAAAGIDAGGLVGGFRRVGLSAVWGRVFRLWLDDDDPGMARTMAALDRSLRRGEELLARADLPIMLSRAVVDFARGWRKARAARRREASSNPPDYQAG